MNTMRTFLTTILLAALTSSASADTCKLLDTTLTPREATVVSLDDTTVTLADQSKLPTTDLVELRWSILAKPKSGYVLLLADGQRLTGRPDGAEGESLRWNGVAGTATIDLKQVRLIMPATAARATFEPSTDDVLKLKNGDSMHGLLNGSDSKAIQFKPAGGTDDVRVEWGNVASLQLAGDAPKPPALDTGAIYRVTLGRRQRALRAHHCARQGAVVFHRHGRHRPDTERQTRWPPWRRLGGKVCWLSDACARRDCR